MQAEIQRWEKELAELESKVEDLKLRIEFFNTYSLLSDENKSKMFDFVMELRKQDLFEELYKINSYLKKGKTDGQA